MKLRYLLLGCLLTIFTSCGKNNIDVQKELDKSNGIYKIEGTVSKFFNIIFPVAYAAQEDFCVDKVDSSNYVKAYAVFADETEKFLCSANIDADGNYKLNLIGPAVDALESHYLKFEVVHSDANLNGLIRVGVEENLQNDANISADEALKSIPQMANFKKALASKINLANAEKDFNANFDNQNVFELFKNIMNNTVAAAKDIDNNQYTYLSKAKDSVLKIVQYSIVNNIVSDPIIASSSDIKTAAQKIQCALIFDYTADLFKDTKYVEACAKQLENSDEQVFQTQYQKLYEVIVNNIALLTKSADTKELQVNLANFKSELSEKYLEKSDIEAINALPLFNSLFKNTINQITNSETIAPKLKSVSEYLATKEYFDLKGIIEIDKLALKNKRSISILSFYTLAKNILNLLEFDTKMSPKLAGVIFGAVPTIISKFNSKTDIELLGKDPYITYHNAVLKSSNDVQKYLPQQNDLATYYSKDTAYNAVKNNISSMITSFMNTKD